MKILLEKQMESILEQQATTSFCRIYGEINELETTEIEELFRLVMRQNL
jgi:hypothetical protein